MVVDILAYAATLVPKWRFPGGLRYGVGHVVTAYEGGTPLQGDGGVLPAL